MTVALLASAIVVVVFAAYAWVTYARAVARGRREVAHVALAANFVILLEAVAITSVDDEAIVLSWLLLFANALGIGAMVSLAGRFQR